MIISNLASMAAGIVVGIAGGTACHYAGLASTEQQMPSKAVARIREASAGKTEDARHKTWEGMGGTKALKLIPFPSAPRR